MEDARLEDFVHRFESGELTGVITELEISPVEEWDPGENWEWKEANAARFDDFIRAAITSSENALPLPLVSKLLGHYVTVLVDQPSATDRCLELYAQVVSMRLDELSGLVVRDMVSYASSPDSSWADSDVAALGGAIKDISVKLGGRPSVD